MIRLDCSLARETFAFFLLLVRLSSQVSGEHTPFLRRLIGTFVNTKNAKKFNICLVQNIDFQCKRTEKYVQSITFPC